MKFYEFNKCEYYALILAKDDMEAIKGYEEVVADLDEEEKELAPDVITKKQAIERFKKANIEHCETEKEKEQYFHEIINDFLYSTEKLTEKYFILLMDGSLI